MKFNCKKTTKIPFALKVYLKELKTAFENSQYLSNESVLHLCQDKFLRNQVERAVLQKKTKDLKEVMVVGIGGSNLGALAAYSALSPYIGKNSNSASLSFFDTAHIRVLKEAQNRMREIYKNNGKILINFISKSGTTNETIMNARVLIDELKKIDNNWQDQIVVTTEPNSKLDNWAIKNNILTLPNPKNVGGRFSVMSPVGLFPLAMAGININKLHKGALKITERCVSGKLDINFALQSALAIFDQMKKRAAINNLFVFAREVEKTKDYLFRNVMLLVKDDFDEVVNSFLN